MKTQARYLLLQILPITIALEVEVEVEVVADESSEFSSLNMIFLLEIDPKLSYCLGEGS